MFSVSECPPPFVQSECAGPSPLSSLTEAGPDCQSSDSSTRSTEGAQRRRSRRKSVRCFMLWTLQQRNEPEDQQLLRQQADMDKQKVLAKLVWDLQSFLAVLDSENLSYIAQAQKKSISELLSKLQTHDAAVEDAEYMIMSCPSLSPSNELTDTPGTGVWSSELLSTQDSSVRLRNGVQGPAVPPHPPGGLGGDDDDDEDTYEEAEPYVPADTSMSNTEKAESDSSHYESYGEEDDDDDDDDDDGEGVVKDRAHYIQWSASQPCLRPAPESRLCGYLWRRKWLGQWTKQLFIIRNNTLLCYKCAQDLLPQLELNLCGCQLVYKSKGSGKIQHQLKLVLLGSETLVLGYNSFQQADEWRKVIEEVSAGGEAETQSSSLIRSDQVLSCRSSTVQTDSEEEKPSAGCSFSRDKGFLNVLMNCQWQSLRCQVEAGLLNMFGEEEEEEEEKEKEKEKEEEEEEEEEREMVKRERSPQYTVQLRGCEVRAGPDTERSYRVTLSMLGDQVAVLEVSSLEEKERWLKLLQDGAANHNHHDNSTQEHTGGALSGLQTRRFPTSNTYMDDPFHLSGPGRDQPIYSNTSMLEHMLLSSQDSVRCSSVSSKDSVTYSNTVFTSRNRKAGEVERGVQKLELTAKRTVQLRAGSEINLASAGKQSKRTSFRQSLAVCTERAQLGFLNPLLRRTASAKNSLRRAPSALFIEHGKVFQRRKEWETKAAA
ncbi:actin filament-associated protein 1-like 2 isoform X2 [Toxotes jaculatrix]|uniref:actin filament-associated protein 1-like 2 isoform X2 n=1 Tax=Toxotes jaculatrix TaxID=941984 RepID=UPI001B3B08AA|nr:actin filament-associated protein 1-like 2 isoform X2 [Toxotes jaculatrix]